uniref:Uncharacterized protein n=1 Tax=Anguilla anguilla TaxID=7936 RepID=A0A0E9RBP1_ANGAN
MRVKIIRNRVQNQSESNMLKGEARK